MNVTTQFTDASLMPRGGLLHAAPGETPVPVLQHYWRIILRRRWVLLGVMAATVLIGLAITALMTPQYTASTTIEISRESNAIVNIQGVQREASDADQEFYQTQYGLLRSRALSERVATQLRLIDDPAFFDAFGELDSRPLFARGGNGRFLPGTRAERLRMAGGLLLANVDITPTRSSRLVEIAFTSPNPDLSARVANAWAQNFIGETLERRYEATSYARNFLEQRLGQLRQRLEESERQVVAYAIDQQIINLPSGAQGGGERSITAENLAALNTELTNATADRIRAEARSRQAGGSNGQSSEALGNSAINGLRQKRAELSADYEKLLTQFEPTYPTAVSLANQLRQLDRDINREESRVSGSLRNSYREAQDREQALQTRVNGLKSQLLDLRNRSIQYNFYQREADTNRTLYDGLLQRYKEIGVAGGVGVNNVAIVDLADRPDRPSRPRIVLNMLLAIVAGAGLGMLVAFLLEQGDETLTDPAEVEQALGIPLLGSVPKVAHSPIDSLLDRKSALVDAYLAVQTNLEFSTDHGAPRTMAITSTRPAEGKSTTALSLAVCLARAGKRVVLVDGDMRSPSVHQLMGIGHDVGLSNFLAGDDDLDKMMHPIEQFGISVITAGPIPPNAAELLTGDRFKRLLEMLNVEYDHVVVDSPPVMGLADAPLIASRVEAVVYAVESHGIQSGLVRTALARLQSANARIIGCVLTKFQRGKSSAGYAYEYGYDYGRKEQLGNI